MSNKKSIILVYGEDQNDRVAIRNLLGATLKSPENFDIRPIQSPIILCRGADQRKRRKMSDEIRAAQDALEKRYSQVIVIAHRDCDSVEPAHVDAAKFLEDELKASGVKNPIAATPAWEMETWLMLFPDALKKTRACWRDWDPSNRNVGMITNAKEFLTRALRPTGACAKACPDYKESDAQIVMQRLKENPSNIDKRSAVSNSFNDFLGKIQKI